MATNNINVQPSRTSQPAHSLLSSLALSAEHMFAIGCLTLVIVLFACGLGGWWFVASWTSSTDDPTQQIVIARRGEIEHSSLDRCPAGRTKFYTASGMVCR